MGIQCEPVYFGYLAPVTCSVCSILDPPLMFPSIDNRVGVERVSKKLQNFFDKFDVPTECVVEALPIGRKKNCSTFRLKIRVHMLILWLNTLTSKF